MLSGLIVIVNRRQLAGDVLFMDIQYYRNYSIYQHHRDVTIFVDLTKTFLFSSLCCDCDELELWALLINGSLTPKDLTKMMEVTYYPFDI